MKLEHLRAFETVARLRSFTRAAEALFLTQPSLSRQIQALESELGATLCERDRSGVSITAAGEVVLPIARRMLADAENARVELDEIAGLRRGRVRLGAPPTLCASIVPDALVDFRANYPGIDLHILEAGSRALGEALNEGALDIALTITRPNVPVVSGVRSEPLFTEQLMVASAVDSAPTEPITLQKLATLPMVALHKSYDLRVATDAAFAAAGLSPTIAVEGAEMDSVLRFVARGIGVAVVPATILADRPLITGTELISPSLSRTVNLSRRSQAQPTIAAAAFEAVLRTTIRNFAVPIALTPLTE